MKNKKTINLDYHKLADEFTEFKTPEQKIEAREKLEEYLFHIVEIEPKYTGELTRRLQNDTDFEEKMLRSVIQISCLLTSSILETIFKFDIVFDVVKKKTKDDYDEIKLFKQYLLNTFSIHEIESEFGFHFSDDNLKIFERRMEMIREYFENY